MERRDVAKRMKIRNSGNVANEIMQIAKITKNNQRR